MDPFKSVVLLAVVALTGVAVSLVALLVELVTFTVLLGWVAFTVTFRVTFAVALVDMFGVELFVEFVPLAVPFVVVLVKENWKPLCEPSVVLTGSGYASHGLEVTKGYSFIPRFWVTADTIKRVSPRIKQRTHKIAIKNWGPLLLNSPYPFSVFKFKYI